MNVLVTIIVPVYQVEQYLERCVQSILSQTYQNLEVLLIDDGSTDSSGGLCDVYAEKDKRIRVFHKQNGGLSDARNYGIDRAKGDYLAFVDSDDYITEDFIETMVESAVRNKSKIVICKYAEVHGEKLSQSQESKERIVPVKEALAHICSNDSQHILYTVVWNKLYQKTLFDTIRYPVGKIHEDEGVTYKMMDQVDTVILIDKVMYGYYMSSDSLTRRSYYEKRQDILEFQLEKVLYFHDKNETELERRARIQLGEMLIYHYYCSRKFLEDSKKIQEKLYNIFRIECFRKQEEFPLWVRMNFSFFYSCKDLYYFLYSVWRKIRD